MDSRRSWCLSSSSQGHALFPTGSPFSAREQEASVMFPRFYEQCWPRRVKVALFGHGKTATTLEHEYTVVTSSSGTSMPPIVLRIDSLRPISSPFGFSPFTIAENTCSPIPPRLKFRETIVSTRIREEEDRVIFLQGIFTKYNNFLEFTPCPSTNQYLSFTK